MDIDTITWEALQTPAQMAAVLVLVMTILLKPLLGWVMEAIAAGCEARGRPVDPDRWDGLRGLLVNLITVGLAAGLAYWRLGRWDGEWFVLVVVSTALAVLGYEGIKNALAGLVKVDVKSLNLFARRE